MTSGSSIRATQAVLRRLGIYNRLKASVLYDFYWNIVNPRLIEEREAQLRFYYQVLQRMPRGALVFDIGANQGVKTDIFLRMGARVIAADPDEANHTVLREKFLSLRFRPKEVVIVPRALSAKEAIETMWIDSPGCTMNTLSQKWVQTLRRDDKRFGAALQFRHTKEIATTTVDNLIKQHGHPYFIKIDVEGFEPSVLRGMHHPVPYLSFEVNLPEFRPEGLECVRLLAALAKQGVFNYAAGNCFRLALTEWLSPDQFADVLQACSDTNIEVFWRN